MSIEKTLSEFGFRHNKGDGTYSKPISDTFFLEVSSDMALHLICDAEGTETGIAHMQVDVDMTYLISAISVVVRDEKWRMEVEALKANNAALMQMLEKK